MDTETREDLLDNLALKDSRLYKKIRHEVLIPNDLLMLGDKDWNLLFAQLTPEEWAKALQGLSPEFQKRLREILPANLWRMMEEAVDSPDETLVEAKLAISKLIRAAMGLIREGRIQNPITEQS